MSSKKLRKGLAFVTVFVMAIGLVGLWVPAVDVRAEGRIDRAGMTIATGFHSLAIEPDGSLWAWGDNSSGQLGNGIATDWDVPNPNPIRITEDVVSVSVGRSHSMAIKSDRSLWAWGENGFGEIGDGTVTWRGSDADGNWGTIEDNNRLYPTHIMNDVVEVSASAAHGGNAAFTLAIRSDGSLWTWGFQEPSEGSFNFTHPSPVRIMEDVIAISAGSHHALAVQSDGSLWAWGVNWSGQLGDGTTNNHPSPVFQYAPIFIMSDVVAVSAGVNHSMAIRSDGSLWAWGENGRGQMEMAQ